MGDLTCSNEPGGGKGGGKEGEDERVSSLTCTDSKNTHRHTTHTCIETCWDRAASDPNSQAHKSLDFDGFIAFLKNRAAKRGESCAGWISACVGRGTGERKVGKEVKGSKEKR
jgi:hypothetical protein